jgi:hypothetical protein
MDLNELYKEIEKAEIDLNAKRLKYIKEALVENGGSIKLKFKKWGEDNNAFDFDDQFPVNENDEIEEDFLDFPSGTDKFDVWHWFDERCPNGVAEDLMYNTEK